MGKMNSKFSQGESPRSSPLSTTNATSPSASEPIFRFEGGRAYHNMANSPYPLPADDQEIDRLQCFHYAIRSSWGSNFSSPVADMLRAGGKKILDVGCGPGTWILENASDFPLNNYTGVDMAPVFPSDIKPANVTFIRANLLDGLPFPDQYFDFVHMRLLVFALTPSQWENQALKELLRLTKSGGYIELCEAPVVKSRGPKYKIIYDALMTILKQREIDDSVPLRLRQMVANTGQLSGIRELWVNQPVGNSFGILGSMYKRLLSESYTLSVTDPMLRILQLTKEEYNALVMEAMMEFEAEAKEVELDGAQEQQAQPQEQQGQVQAQAQVPPAVGTLNLVRVFGTKI